MVGGSLRQLSTFVQSWTCLSQAARLHTGRCSAQQRLHAVSSCFLVHRGSQQS